MINILDKVEEINPNIIVIGGLAKTGTTLPLVLLDNHPQLLVFPEELRFFHRKCDYVNGKEAANRLFNCGNIKKLKLKDTFFDKEHYIKHSGTGFGRRDYSKFNFDQFEDIVRDSFIRYDSVRNRFFSIVFAFYLALYGKLPKKNFIFVCKAPHNELYIDKWNSILGNNGKYIICTRVPTEHYLSLSKVHKMVHNKKYDIFQFIKTVKYRRKLWEKFPLERRLILDYDKILNNTKIEINAICDLIGIDFNENLLTPTKMGIPWGGGTHQEA